MVYEEYRGNCHYVFYGAISTLTIVTSGVKWLGHEADFSPPIRAEELSFYSAMCFMTWHLIGAGCNLLVLLQCSLGK
jgi:hypothetical protein